MNINDEPKSASIVHQGTAMLDIIARTTFSITDVAGMIGVTRRTIYLWGKKEVLESYMIDRVGNAISIDIRATMPGTFDLNSKVVPLAKSEKIQSEENSILYWKEKYEIKKDELDFLRLKLKIINKEIADVINLGSKISVKLD